MLNMLSLKDCIARKRGLQSQHCGILVVTASSFGPNSHRRGPINFAENTSWHEQSLKKRPLMRDGGGGANAKTNNHIEGLTYLVCGHFEQVAETYLLLSGKVRSKLKQVATPCIEDHILLEDKLEHKVERPIKGARIVLKALYVARVVRPDVYFVANTLAR